MPLGKERHNKTFILERSLGGSVQDGLNGAGS